MGAQKWLYAIYKVWSSLKPNKWGIYWGYCRAMKFRSWVNSNEESKKQIMACLCLVNLHWILTSNAGIGWTLCLCLLTKLSRPQANPVRPWGLKNFKEMLNSSVESLKIPIVWWYQRARPHLREGVLRVPLVQLASRSLGGRMSAADVHLGSRNGSGNWWTGGLVQFMVWNRWPRMRRSCWCRAYLASEICGNPSFRRNVRIKGPRGRI